MATPSTLTASRLLLDTNVLLWWLEGNSRLSPSARKIIRDAEVVFVSAVSAWEISTKARQGKLVFRGDLAEHLVSEQFEPLSIRMDHAILSAALPLHHRDPFDRMLIAQARIESLTLLTSDSWFKAYAAAVFLV